MLAGLVAISSVRAGPFEDGETARNAGDYALALGLYLPLAEQGDPRAQHEVGFLYKAGHGVPADNFEAMYWFRLAAAQGHPDSQHSLGLAYRSGDGAAQDHVEAARWFRLSAEQGNAFAQSNLAEMYYEGAGVPRSAVQAYAWASVADDQGHPWARGLIDLVAGGMSPAQIAEAQALTAGLRAQYLAPAQN